MTKKRKRKLKKSIKKFLILALFTIVLITIFIIINNKPKEKTIIKKEIDLNTIVEKINDTTITKEFLTWIKTNYGDKAINTLEKEEYTKELWHQITGNSYIVLKDLYNKNYENKDNIKIIDKKGDITLSFIGDVSLADNWYIMPKYDEREKKVYGILSEETVDIMNKTDIMVANNEFTISNRGEKMPGKYYTFRGNPKRLSIYDEMGVDLVTLANNHVYDFGEIAFNDMLDSLKEYKIPYIGAGKNIEEAMKPYYFIINGYKISFVNATRAEKLILTPEATQTKGGVFRCYDPTNLTNLIKEEKQKSDYVIALIHWGREDSHDLEEVQKTTSKTYIDAGADLIIGSHAHVLQGIEFYKEKPIIYNLGDFIFNNETKDTGIFQTKLKNDGTMEYLFIPAIESNEYTKVVEGDEKERILNNMNKWSPNAKLDNNGIITENK